MGDTMGKAIHNRRPTVEELLRDADMEFQEWEYIHAHGCQDPFYEDGVNLELVRNHIIYDYRQLAELLDGVQFNLFSEVGFDPEKQGLRPLPPEYPINWMCPTGDYPGRLAWKR